jgi:hypothetical protein
MPPTALQRHVPRDSRRLLALLGARWVHSKALAHKGRRSIRLSPSAQRSAKLYTDWAVTTSSLDRNHRSTAGPAAAPGARHPAGPLLYFETPLVTRQQSDDLLLRRVSSPY